MRYLKFCVVIAFLAALPSARQCARGDDALAAARKFVENSQKYLHHDKLERGMKGYGLSVFSGTKIERFDVEIISVMRNFRPRQDIILARLSKQNLSKSMVVHGMSGSPVFVKDPADGKYKMIGAVAYGFSRAPVVPICGLQPITQMLAIPGVLDEPAQKKPEKNKAPSTRPARPKSRPSTNKAPATRNIEEFLRIVLAPGKVDFARLNRPPAGASEPTGQNLRPLQIPMTVTGCGDETLQFLRKQFTPMRLIPLAGGSVGGEDKIRLQKIKLQPGASLAVPLVTGDADWSATGTVTEVIGNRVIGFGHPMLNEGNVHLPMGTGFVHTIIADQFSSYKMGASIRRVGELTRDESVGVGGVIGKTDKARSIPMKVRMTHAEDGRVQTFNYRLVDDWYFAPTLSASLVFVSAKALRGPPRYYHVRYSVEIDFGKLGVFKARNKCNGRDLWWGVYDIASDVARPMAALLRNPFGPRPEVKSINVEMEIHKGDIGARIIDFKLDAATHRPGDTVTGRVLLERFRKARLTVPVRLKLPDDLPDGKYTLTAGDFHFAITQQQTEQPQYSQPRTVGELLGSLRRLSAPQADRIYLHLPLPGGGLALGRKKLPDMPPGKAQVLLQAKMPDTRVFRRSMMPGMKTKYVIHGRKQATVVVKKHINETLVR